MLQHNGSQLVMLMLVVASMVQVKVEAEGAEKEGFYFWRDTDTVCSRRSFESVCKPA